MPDESSGIIQLVIAGTVLLVLVGGFIVSFMIFYKQKQRQYELEKKALEDHFNQETLRSQLEIREQTLKNISQEIHDNIGQTLSLAKLHLHTTDEDVPRLTEKIADSKQLVAKAIQDLRTLSRTLNPDNIERTGLIPAIALELEQVEKAGNFKASLSVIGNIQRLEPDKELILFRIVQEALQNIIKHSAAESIEVNAVFEYDEFQLSIKDNGKGFTEILHDRESGSGLSNMYSRAKLIGGEMQLITQPNNGTNIFIKLPTRPE